MRFAKILSKALSYPRYKRYITDLIQSESDPERLKILRHNHRKMEQVEQETTLLPKLNNVIKKINQPLIWLILVDPWNEENARHLPVMALIAQASPNLQASVVLKDRNKKIMDYFLTDGKAATPKLICLDAYNFDIQGSWGPRPATIQQKIDAFKEQHPDRSRKDILNHLNTLYERDRGISLQEELFHFLPCCETHIQPNRVSP